MKKIFVIVSLSLIFQSYGNPCLLSQLNADAIETSDNPTDYVYRASQNPEESSIEFVDLDGNILIVYPVQLKYDISSLPDGVYIIQSLDKEGIILSSKKFVKNS